MHQISVEEMIDYFLADPNLIKAANYEKNLNFFDICKINETKHSGFLSWLLNPREAHGLGDLFIKELLKEIITRWRNLDNQKKMHLYKNIKWFSKKPSIYDVEMASYSDSIIFTEFKAGDNKNNGNGNYFAVDIALVNNKQNLIVFIENKYGAPEGSDQTPKYYKYLNRKYGQKYKLIFIYLDKNFKDNFGTNINKNWIATNYEWIQNFLKSKLEKKDYNPSAEKLLRDYYVYISEDYDSDPFTYQVNKTIRELSREHKDLLKALKTEYHSVKNKQFEEIETHKTTIQTKVYYLYKLYGWILDYMEDYTEQELIAEIVKKELNIKNEYLYIYSDSIAITHPKLVGHKKDDGAPAIDVTFKQEESINLGEDNGNISDKAQVYIYIDINRIPDEYLDKVIEFILKETEQTKINRARRHYSINIKDFTDKPKDEEIVKKMRVGYDKLEKLAAQI
jgi:hypothetical protein